MRIWIEKTIVKNRRDRNEGELRFGNMLWSPQVDKVGKDIYKNMREVNTDDIIIHLTDNNAFTAVSKAATNTISEVVNENTAWDGKVYKIKLKGFTSISPLPRNRVLKNSNRRKLEEISAKGEVFYNKNLDLRQGAYLTPCSPELFYLINDEYKLMFNKDLPYFNEFKDHTPESDDARESQKSYSLNQILFGPPGTGKTYYSVIYAVAICDNKDVKDLESEDFSNVLKRFNELKGNNRIEFTTFHQSYGYEEFIEGIKPVISEKSENELSYKYEDGIFKKFCEAAEKYQDSPRVFIIDEINRGNISKIFGELITLIEPSKRIGEKEELKTTLPYTRISFGVPKNVYILGTMNTADRSIAIIDTALRRRFNFIEMIPNYNVLLKLQINEIDTIDIIQMLKTMNDRIECLYDREHTIGHAYFIPLIENPTLEKLKYIFLNSIIPLLQEYFYEDYSKIQLILGDNNKTDEFKFILDKKINTALFRGNLEIELPEKSYSIQEEAFEKVESYKLIY
ncbi:MAG: AAA family ATPase [Bacilli bacterium]|nr:AAA family ATPase [Bacilli bacterium]